MIIHAILALEEGTMNNSWFYINGAKGMAEENVKDLHDLSRETAHSILNDIASHHSERVIITYHAEERMKNRKISIRQVFNCLKNGRFKDEPYWNNAAKNWQMTIETITAGDGIGLAIALETDDKGNKIIIITAYSA